MSYVVRVGKSVRPCVFVRYTYKWGLWEKTVGTLFPFWRYFFFYTSVNPKYSYLLFSLFWMNGPQTVSGSRGLERDLRTHRVNLPLCRFDGRMRRSSLRRYGRKERNGSKIIRFLWFQNHTRFLWFQNYTLLTFWNLSGLFSKEHVF